MDGTAHPISPDDLYSSLGGAKAPLLIDVRRPQAFDADKLLIIGAARRLPDEVASGGNHCPQALPWLRTASTVMKSANEWLRRCKASACQPRISKAA